jgi:hypothetical protein
MEEKRKIEAANGDNLRLRSSLACEHCNLLDREAQMWISKQVPPKNGKPTDRWAF